MVKSFRENKGRSRRRPVVVVASLGLSLAGCSEMSGLRSVGTDRPSLLTLWERPKTASPKPGADSYAQAMHANDDKLDDSDALAESEPANPRVRGDSTAAANRAKLARRDPKLEGPSTESPADHDKSLTDADAVRVTLGQPTALPSARLATAVAAAQPSDRDAQPRGWKSERSTAPPAESSELALAATPGSKATRADVDPRAILAQVEKAVDRLESYQVHMTRAEKIGDASQPEEHILLSIRRKPRAVRLEWTSGPNKGREVIYSEALDPRSLFVHMPATGLPIPTMKISVDSPLVRKNSRHSITEAGFDVMLKELLLAGVTNSARVDYRGRKTPEGDDTPAYHFVHHDDHDETWDVYLDTRSLLPRRVEARDAHGRLIEHYVYNEMQPNPESLATADAFTPDARWGRSDGMLSRIARSFDGTSKPPTASR